MAQPQVSMPRVFVSYARSDAPVAGCLVEWLRGESLSVFWDRDLPVGDRWVDFLDRELDSADGLLVLWTATSIRSRWVRLEAEEARKRGRLLPLRLEDVPQPLEFRDLQAFDLIGWRGDDADSRLPELLVAVQRRLARPEQPLPPAAVSLPPRSPWQRRRRFVAMAAVAAIFLVVAVALQRLGGVSESGRVDPTGPSASGTPAASAASAAPAAPAASAAATTVASSASGGPSAASVASRTAPASKAAPHDGKLPASSVLPPNGRRSSVRSGAARPVQCERLRDLQQGGEPLEAADLELLRSRC